MLILAPTLGIQAKLNEKKYGTGTIPVTSSNKTSKYVTPTLSDYNYDSLYKGYGGSSGGGGYTVAKADISGLLDSFEKEAATNRQIAQSTYDTTKNDLATALKRAEENYNLTRNDLATSLGRAEDTFNLTKGDLATALQAIEDSYNLTRNDLGTSLKRSETVFNNTRTDLLNSLKRFQEQNTIDVKNQQQNYNTEQAALENARALADRNSRISSAARGLGGSGLQQLAQLQNMLSQSSEISTLANKNQNIMDDLREALNTYTEDNESDMRQAENTLKEAQENYDSALAKATLNYDQNRAANQSQLRQAEAILNQAREDYNTNLNKASIAYRQDQEDYDTDLAKALTNYQNTMSSIESLLSGNKASAIATNEAQYTAALNNARAQAAARASANSNASSMADKTVNQLKAITDYMNDKISSLDGMSTKELKSLSKTLTSDGTSTTDKNTIAKLLAQQAKDSVEALNASENFYIDTNNFNTVNSNINTLLNSYLKQLSKGYSSAGGIGAFGFSSGGGTR